jgi:hypothetical protein
MIASQSRPCLFPSRIQGLLIAAHRANNRLGTALLLNATHNLPETELHEGQQNANQLAIN